MSARRDNSTAAAELPGQRAAASPVAGSTQRHGVRLFVAGHVGAVTLVYLLAAWVGDGKAPPPVPPDLSAAQRPALLATVQPDRLGPDAVRLDPARSELASGQRQVQDLAAPWHAPATATADPRSASPTVDGSRQP